MDWFSSCLFSSSFARGHASFRFIRAVDFAHGRACVAARGWLVFATHDVEANPSRYGCTPELFERVLRWSVHSGARILPVARALRQIRTEAGAAA